MSVNDKVRALRELNNWSQEEVAERMQISESSYSRLERGKSKLDLEKLEKLAAIFKKSFGLPKRKCCSKRMMKFRH